MAIMRARVQLSGFRGAPGLNTFYGIAEGMDLPVAANNFADRIVAFYNEINGPTTTTSLMVDGYTATVEGTMAVIDEATGDLISEIPVTTSPLSVEGDRIGNQSPNATQFLVRFSTGGIVNNRLVKGRVFVGPLFAALDQDGTPTAAAATQVRDAAQTHLVDPGDTLVDQPTLQVWSRPFEGSATVDPRVGTTHIVIGASVPDFFAVLRSRRD